MLPKSVPKSDYKWRRFAKKYILLTLQSIADPKNQLKPCIKPTERGIVDIFKLKNDEFMVFIVKIAKYDVIVTSLLLEYEFLQFETYIFRILVQFSMK